MSVINTFNAVLAGFVEKEIKKANIPIMDTGENPEVPFPRDMIDLEVMMLKDSASISSGWKRRIVSHGRCLQILVARGGHELSLRLSLEAALPAHVGLALFAQIQK